ncbi:Uncharacterised protein [Chlamydia trachomatis]|nr:Uncharacterised protein [Chlamydia trachomatis]
MLYVKFVVKSDTAATLFPVELLEAVTETLRPVIFKLRSDTGIPKSILRVLPA